MDKKKTILITGTSKGIGRFLAEYYSSSNFNVIGCSRSKAAFKNQNYKHFETDVTDEIKVKELFKYIRENFGHLNVLINNAGIASMNHVLLTPLSSVRKIFEVNFTGMFLFSREASKLMSKDRNGRIINLSTVAVDLNLEGEAVYTASKSAVVSFTKVLAKELSEYGITVNSVGLTPIKTDLIKNIPKDKIESLLEKLTLKRFTENEDITNIIDFLIKDDSGFITGQNINFGGV